MYIILLFLLINYTFASEMKIWRDARYFHAKLPGMQYSVITNSSDFSTEMVNI